MFGTSYGIMEWTFSICFYILDLTFLAVCSGVMETFLPAYLILDTYLRMVTKIYLCQTETFPSLLLLTGYVFKNIYCYLVLIIIPNFIHPILMVK